MLHLETALPQLDSIFVIRYPDGVVVELLLVEAVDLGSTERQEQFQLLFKGPAQPFLAQGTYGLAHPVLGELLVFLVPNAQLPNGFMYHAVYNRMIR